MAILSVTESIDSDIILIKYSLINEVFQNISVYPAPVTVGNSQVAVTTINTNHTTEETVHGTFTVSVPASRFSTLSLRWAGVYMFELNTLVANTPVQSYGSVMLGKTIDCCIADKMYTAVDCDCADDKCNESLIDAQKMYLFKKSGEFVLRSLPSSDGPTTITAMAGVQDAQKKYEKAVELCTTGCGCGSSNSVSSGTGGY